MRKILSPQIIKGHYSATGTFATYRFYLIAQPPVVESQKLDVGQLNNGVYTDRGFLTRIPGQVIVQNANTPTAQIYSAQILGPGTALKTSAGLPIVGKEPSVSLDGRIVIFGSGSHPFDPNYNGELAGSDEMFVFSSNPENPQATWSPATNLADAYYLYGPGRAVRVS